MTSMFALLTHCVHAFMFNFSYKKPTKNIYFQYNNKKSQNIWLDLTVAAVSSLAG